MHGKRRERVGGELARDDLLDESGRTGRERTEPREPSRRSGRQAPSEIAALEPAADTREDGPDAECGSSAIEQATPGHAPATRLEREHSDARDETDAARKPTVP
jgi:hypothetical protein